MTPSQPQFSLRWLFLEMTLVAVALACVVYVFRTPNLYRPEQVFLPFFAFFMATGSAIGGLFQWPVIGGLVGLGIAIGFWIHMLPYLGI